jgi:hydrogenase nickel incorporation protein HypA/HybF
VAIMHEFSIARSMVEAACEEARRIGATRITLVRCRIGTLRYADDWLMREAFEVAKLETLCSTAGLAIEKAYMQAACPQCRTRFAIRDWDWSCPDCGAIGEDAAGGDELELLSFDAEVPDERARAAQRI